MGSINARGVAKEVLENIGRGKRPILGKILEKNGYAKATAKNPKLVTSTKSYQETIANDPFVKAMIRERDAAIARMAKVRSKAKYRDLTDAADKLNKNIQLATGGKTDNTGLQITWE